MTKFVSLENGNLIINLDKICAVEKTASYYNIVIDGGKTYTVYEEDGIKIINLLNIDSSSTTKFDPDKRIGSTTTTTATTTPASTINKIRMIVNKHNEASMHSVAMDVSSDATTITIKGRGYDYQKSIVITNGIVTTDSLQGSVYSKLKEGILGIL